MLREIHTARSRLCGIDSLEVGGSLLPRALVPLALNVLCHLFRYLFPLCGVQNSVTVPEASSQRSASAVCHQVQHFVYPCNSDVAAPRNRPRSEAHFRLTEAYHKTVGRTSARGLSCHSATLTNWLPNLRLSSGATWRLSQDFVLRAPLLPA